MKQDRLATTHKEPSMQHSATVETPRVALPHAVIVRAPGLLPMLYRPSELAQDMEVPETTLRDWFGRGLPHQRDERGHIWINGQEFAAWVKACRKSPLSQKMAEDEAYCFRCQQPVKLVLGTVGLSKTTCSQGALRFPLSYSTRATH